MSRALRTALIIQVPEADGLVAPFRSRMDPTAPRGVPAHITVLYPFAPVAQLTDETMAALRELFAKSPSFAYSLTRADWFGKEVLWLAPEPREPFVLLTEAVMEAHPDYPPYGGLFDDIQPHLTVADHAAYADMLEAQRNLDSWLPVFCIASAVTVMVEQESGQWRRRASLRFQPETPEA